MSTTAQPQRGVQALNGALHAIFAARDDVVLLGEDVLDPYGGAFKVTAGLSDAYPDRVLTTPISEASLFGVAAGMALRGQRPILEIMFGDFVALGLDQVVNGISKFREMYDEQVTVPLVVRAPMGAPARVRADPQPVPREAAARDPEHLRRRMQRVPRRRRAPHRCGRGRAPGLLRREQAPLRTPAPAARGRAHGGARRARVGRSVPGVSFSGNGLLGGHGDDRHVRRDAPGRRSTRRRSSFSSTSSSARSSRSPSSCRWRSTSWSSPSRRTGALVTAEEGTLTGGIGAEIAARVQDAAWSDLRAPVQRVAARDGIIPSARAARGRDAAERAGRRRRGHRARRRERLRPVLEIVLTREDANTEHALLAEWLVEDRAEVEQGQPVCVVETTKATVEVESPGAGTIVQLFAEGPRSSSARRSRTSPSRRTSSPRSTTRAEEKPAPKRCGRAQGDAQGGRARRAARRRPRGDREARVRHGEGRQAEIDRRRATDAPSADPLLAGVSTEGVSLPATFDPEGTERHARRRLRRVAPRRSGRVPRALARRTRSRRCASHGAVVGDGVDLGEGSFVVAPRIVSRGRCAARPARDGRVRGGRRDRRGLRSFGADLELRCRRAFLGAGIHGGAPVRFGGGGHRDPWATLVVGDLAFVGDEVFVNVCRPVLIGREVFLTMRALLVTHNIGHSVLEGFENRFAPIVLEDRSQVGLGAVVYAGSRVGAEAIVASNSYVVGDVPAGAFAIGVPAKVTGSSSHKLVRRPPARARATLRRRPPRAARASRSRGLGDRGSDPRGFEVEGTRVLFTPSYRGGVDAPAVVLTLDVRGDVPDGVAVLDLLGRQRARRAAESCSTPCASSAASAGSASSRGRGATPAASLI